MRTQVIIRVKDHMAAIQPLVEYLCASVDDSSRPERPKIGAVLREYGRGSNTVLHTLPSAEFLRWLADMVEVSETQPDRAPPPSKDD